MSQPRVDFTWSWSFWWPKPALVLRVLFLVQLSTFLAPGIVFFFWGVVIPVQNLLPHCECGELRIGTLG